MDEQDLQIDNILARKKAKPKVDGKAKGNRTELHLCKLLTKHFGEEFTKAPGSGARWAQVNYLPEHARKTLTGDLCVPEHFLWVVESKGGYEDDIDLNAVLDGKGISRLDEFIEQSGRDSEYCGRKPIVCWKRNRRPWLAMVRENDLALLSEFGYRIHYRDWVVVALEELLAKTARSFWFGSAA